VIRHWLGYRSPLTPVWLWHATFDGTRLCGCPHSRWYRGEMTVQEFNALEAMP
jgi:hypothetical protein